MSVIVYRNGVLAADSLTTVDSVIVGTRIKIFKTEGGVLGGWVGDSDMTAAFAGWVRKGFAGRFAAAPGAHEGAEGNGIIISTDGKKVWHVCNGGPAHSVTAQYHAIGCGSPVAIGAMAVGADAVTAVKAAIANNVYCGGEVSIELTAEAEAKVRAAAAATSVAVPSALDVQHVDFEDRVEMPTPKPPSGGVPNGSAH